MYAYMYTRRTGSKSLKYCRMDVKLTPSWFMHLTLDYGLEYSPTYIKQAPKGQSKSASLRQVLARYRCISMCLPVLGTEYMLA